MSFSRCYSSYRLHFNWAPVDSLYINILPAIFESIKKQIIVYWQNFICNFERVFSVHLIIGWSWWWQETNSFLSFSDLWYYFFIRHFLLCQKHRGWPNPCAFEMNSLVLQRKKLNVKMQNELFIRTNKWNQCWKVQMNIWDCCLETE